jgi:hypothetical protein
MVSNEQLQQFKKAAESAGFNIDALFEDLEEVWDKAEPDVEFDNTQKAILCLALTNLTLSSAAAQLNYSKTSLSPAASRGIYKALTVVCQRRGIRWSSIIEACTNAGYNDAEYQRKSICKELRAKNNEIQAVAPELWQMLQNLCRHCP